MRGKKQQNQNTKGRNAALVMVGSAVFFIATMGLEQELGLSNRVGALLNLAALAGFGWALWMTYGIWRERQTDRN